MTPSMSGTATCYGAATIINGIVTGKGAAFGIGLKTVSQVDLTNEPGRYSVRIEGDPLEDISLSTHCVRNVLKKFDMADQYGARITTRSDIPISRGLKSSSAASNALILATLKAIGEKWDGIDVINAGVDSSLEAKVTITGAFDDACATYFGNVVVCDNIQRKILKQYSFSEELSVLIHVPGFKIRKSEVDRKLTAGIQPLIDLSFQQVMKKDHACAMMINGFSYGHVMGLDSNIAVKAIQSGAISAGISGTGPSTVILCHPEDKNGILEDLDIGSIIETSTNDKQAFTN